MLKLNLMKKGKFIVIEGVDGAGKGTQINLLKDFLINKKKMHNFVFLREPGGTRQGEKIREIILNYDISSKTELLLFYASRNELLINHIIPALKEGKNVICDRYELSTFAYQIYGRNQKENKKLIGILQKEISIIPDKYYFFDLNVETAKIRTKLRNEKNTRFDNEEVAFFNRVRGGYKKELPKYNYKIIDSSKEINDIKKEFFVDILNFLDIK